MAPEIPNNPKFTKELEMFANWNVDGAQYAFHENFPNLRISKPPSNKI